MNKADDKENQSKYDLIAQGISMIEQKWGLHCDEVQRQLKDGRLTEEQAKELNGGWSVAEIGRAHV